MYKLGQVIKKNGEEYTVYKIQECKIYAESELGSIICIPNLKIVS